MIQRIQSVYIFLAITIAIFMGLNNLDFSSLGFHHGFWVLFALEVWAFLAFKNRKKQIACLYLALGVNFLLICLIASYLLSVLGEPSQWGLQKSIELSALVFSLIFLWLAIRGVKKDEQLVKSVDRFR